MSRNSRPRPINKNEILAFLASGAAASRNDRKA